MIETGKKTIDNIKFSTELGQYINILILVGNIFMDK